MDGPTTTTTPDGVLLVDKDAGRTSHDVVAIARRALGTRRIGHAGTLDPFATGLLVLLVGRATRLLPYVDGEPKVYDTEIAFGAATDTDDVTGSVVRQAALPTEQRVHEAIRALTGTIAQVPPAYSAKQVGGRRAHAAARGGRPLELAPVSVTVHEWRIGSLSSDRLRATIICAGGTYVRALARDLGERADSAAHVISLRRLASGPFRVERAITVAQLASEPVALLPMRAAIPSVATQVLSADERLRVRHGNAIAARGAEARVALLDADGALVAVARRDGELLQPALVMHGE